MKTTKVKITATQFENGHILLGKSDGAYFVQVEPGMIMEYSKGEMKEIYNYED